VISGTMPLLGGNKARGILVRIGGGVMLFLSILSMLAPDNISSILLVVIFGILAGVYFFIKGDEPTEKEAKLYGFKSAKDELKTYGDAIKGMTVFFVVLIVIFGSIFALLQIFR
jgi:hypothetical protein